MCRLLPLLVAVGLLWPGWRDCVAETIQARHSRVELLSAQNNVVPGQELLLGLHFSLEKSWHIYWTNPGDSGQPPVLQWQLPPGLVAGAVQWPVPEKLKRSSLADYGYEDDVVLLAPVHISAGFKDGGKAELGLQAKWLICSDVCIPDHAQLHLSLPVPSSSDQKSSSLLTESKKRLPQPWPHSWKASAISNKDNFILSVITGKPIQLAEFYPLNPNEIENAAPQPVQASRTGVKITLQKSDQFIKPVQVLKGLLVLSGGKTYAIAAPVGQ